MWVHVQVTNLSIVKCCEHILTYKLAFTWLKWENIQLVVTLRHIYYFYRSFNTKIKIKETFGHKKVSSIHAIKILDLVNHMFPCLAKKHFLSIRLKCKFTIITFLGVAFVFEIIQNISHVFIYFEIQLYWWILLVNFMSSTCVKKKD